MLFHPARGCGRDRRRARRCGPRKRRSPCPRAAWPPVGRAEEVDRLEDRGAQGVRVHGRELEAGGDPGVQGGDVCVDHGVGEPADPGHDRHAAVAQPVELGQAAGLEPRGSGWRRSRPASGGPAARHSRCARRCGRDGSQRGRGAPSIQPSPEPSTASRPPAATRSWAVSTIRSMPFCPVSRVMAQKIGPGPGSSPKASSIAARLTARPEGPGRRSGPRGSGRWPGPRRRRRCR